MSKIIFIVLIALTALLVIAIKFLPWWGIVLLFVALILGVRYGLGFVLKTLFTLPFKAKGKALAGATVQVHAISPAPLPILQTAAEDEDEQDYVREEEEENQNLNWYFLDLTLSPPGRSDGFVHWEPGELLFVGMDAKPDDIGEDELSGKLHDYQIFVNGAFQDDEVDKHSGPLRVKFHVGLPDSMEQLQLRYYFELFGQIQLPQTA